MNLFRRAAAAAVALCLLLTLSPPARAAGSSVPSSESESAQTLYRLGLFQGTVPGRFDEQSMALARPAGRAEALAMFLRLLGREDAARTGACSHPFSDVPGWADFYVGYALREGLAKGTGGGRFEAERVITLNEYVSFLLRAAEYDDTAGDFSWQTAAGKGLELELYDDLFLSRSGKGMTRGQMAQVSCAALSLSLKSGSETLGGMLARLGVVNGAALTALNIPLKPVDKTALAIQKVVDLVNQARAAEGLAPLVLDQSLTDCAMARAREIEKAFSHTRPDGRPWHTVFNDYGQSYRRSGENIALGYTSAQAVMEGWMNSPGHRANILTPEFTRMGVGAIGRQWVQLFAG